MRVVESHFPPTSGSGRLEIVVLEPNTRVIFSGIIEVKAITPRPYRASLGIGVGSDSPTPGAAAAHCTTGSTC